MDIHAKADAFNKKIGALSNEPSEEVIQEIVDNFLLVDEKNKQYLSDPVILQKIVDKISALSRDTPEQAKQSLFSVLGDQSVCTSQHEASTIRSQIYEVCRSKYTEAKKVLALIASTLIGVVSVVYPELEDSPLAKQFQTPIDELFNFIATIDSKSEYGSPSLDKWSWDTVLGDITKIQTNLGDSTYQLYTFHRTRGKENGKESFINHINKCVNVIPKLQKILAYGKTVASKMQEIMANNYDDAGEDAEWEAELQQHIESHKIFIRQSYVSFNGSSEKDRPLLREEIERGAFDYMRNEMSLEKELFYNVGGENWSSRKFYETLGDYCNYRIMKKRSHLLGNVDTDTVLAKKMKYGAKGAYLDAVRDMLPKISKHMRKRVIVPSFDKISTRYYDKRYETKELDHEYFTKLYQKWQKKKCPIIIRSSAVYSEDNQETTGAGVYESICLGEEFPYKDFSYQEFCEAIIKVYESCNSESALAYRAEHDIPEEKMGLVIQTFIEYNPAESNSILPHRPELLEIKYHNRRAIIEKRKFIPHLYEDFMDDPTSCRVYNGDLGEHIDVGYEINDIGTITYAFERYFGQPMQAELVLADVLEHNSPIYYIVQARPLPMKLMEPCAIEFPEEKEPLWEGRALGICDEELEILPIGADNRDKTGIVIFATNNNVSGARQEVINSLPAHGVVLMTSESGTKGHIETLCAEKNIVCLFTAPLNKSVRDGLHVLQFLTYGSAMPNAMTYVYDAFYGHKKVRVVADGLEGRVYPIEDKDITTATEGGEERAI